MRPGEALLAGLFRFGPCGRKRHVACRCGDGRCPRAIPARALSSTTGRSDCISFPSGGFRVDAEVDAGGISGPGTRSPPKATTRSSLRSSRPVLMLRRLRRQNDAVDPDNRPGRRRAQAALERAPDGGATASGRAPPHPIEPVEYEGSQPNCSRQERASPMLMPDASTRRIEFAMLGGYSASRVTRIVECKH